MDNKIEAIRDYFMKCPLLKNGVLNIDSSDNLNIGYSINADFTSERIEKKFMDGEKRMIYPFLFTSSEVDSIDIADKINSYGFYEKLEEWIDDNNQRGIVPNFEGTEKINVLTDGYLVNASGELAVYQIPMQLVYLKGGQ